MEKGICHLAFIPLRKEPVDASEMISQILFGETYDILEKSEKWARIRNHFDQYEGWIFGSSILNISESEFISLAQSSLHVVSDPFITATHNDPSKNIILPFGSLLHNFESGRFELLGEEFKTLYFNKKYEPKVEQIKNAAIQLINTPYLWGGRSSFGIDCSGLVQNCFRMIDIRLPRDAYQQAELGSDIKLPEAKPGDVAFFSNEKGRIVHTGILLENYKIIHASVRVRIDKLDEKGILNIEKGLYTHSLAVIKRYL